MCNNKILTKIVTLVISILNKRYPKKLNTNLTVRSDCKGIRIKAKTKNVDRCFLPL